MLSRVLIAVLLSLSGPASTAAPKACSELTLKRALAPLNPIDPTLGETAFPLQGRKIEFASPVKKGEYQLFWELGAGTDGKAFIALNRAGKRVTIKRVPLSKTTLGRSNLQEWVTLHNEAMDWLNRHGHTRSVKIQEAFVESGAIYLVKPYIPGFDFPHLETLIHEPSKLKTMKVLLDQKMELLKALEPEAETLPLRNFNHTHRPFDSSEENYVWFKGAWYFIDPIKMP